MVVDNAFQWKETYSNFGYCCFPLKPGTKQPIKGRSWTKEPNEELWKDMPANVNIAIRCGGASNLLVIDCDDKTIPGTFDKVSRFLSGLGLNTGLLPLVQTASRSGRHIYLKCLNPPNGDIAFLSPQLGSGEIRHSDRCYVVAPPSQIEGIGDYRLITGDFSIRPLIDFNDLRPIIKNHKYEKYNSSEILDKVSRNGKRLLFGKSEKVYTSRSERDFALMVSLINSGLNENEIRFLFMTLKIGKFWEKHQQSPTASNNYFSISYHNAKSFAENNTSEDRQRALDAIKWANTIPWKGRTGSFDKAVFLAHCDIAYRSAKKEYQASCRELAELSGMSIGGAINANYRLVQNGVISVIKPGVANLATIYSIVQTLTLPQQQPVRECLSMHNHDVFRYQGLGKSGCEIWEALQEGPKSIDEIAMQTGRHRTTINRKLEKMSKIVDLRTGEVASMVNFNGHRYKAKKEIDLEYIAELLGTKGTGKRQKEQHMIERKRHNEKF